LSEVEDDTTESLLSALQSRVRRAVLRTVIEAEAPLSPKELAAHHRVTLQTMCHHVKTLVEVEGMTLVKIEPTGRTVQRFYEPGPACRRPLVRDAIGIEVDEV
jgi:DNA-binding transcriptional ArsR family regulator